MTIAPRRQATVSTSATSMDEGRYFPALLGVLAAANLTAYARDAVIAGAFGANARTDAYFVGAFIPTLLSTILVLESAVPALLPALAQIAADGEATRTLLRTVLAAATATLTAVCILIWLAASPVVGFLAHGWGSSEVAIGASILRITAGSLVPLGMGAILTAALNVRHRYLAPPLGLVLMNATVIASTFLLGHQLGVDAPAWGMVTGSCVYLLVQLWSVTHLTFPPPAAGMDVPYAMVWRSMPPTLLFSLLVQNVVVVERWLASALPPGRISYLTYAGKLMMSPLLVITAAGGLLAFVAMSHATAADDQPAFRASLARSVRIMVLLLSAATLALVFLGQPLVRLALQHGHFTGGDAAETASLLSIYAFGLVPNGIAWLLYRSLQSRGFYWEAVRVAFVVTAVYVACAVFLFHIWALRGLAAAFPISQSVSCLVLYARQRAFLSLDLGEAARFAASVAVICALEATALGGIHALVRAAFLGTAAAAVVTLAGGTVAILVGLPVALKLLRVPEGDLLQAWLASLPVLRARWSADAGD